MQPTPRVPFFPSLRGSHASPFDLPRKTLSAKAHTRQLFRPGAVTRPSFISQSTEHTDDTDTRRKDACMSDCRAGQVGWMRSRLSRFRGYSQPRRMPSMEDVRPQEACAAECPGVDAWEVHASALNKTARWREGVDCLWSTLSHPHVNTQQTLARVPHYELETSHVRPSRQITAHNMTRNTGHTRKNQYVIVRGGLANLGQMAREAREYSRGVVALATG